MLAFSGYVGVAFLFFGLRVVFQPRLSYVGTGVDPQIFIWSFAWWPHAILHGENPFVTHVVWAPSGLKSFLLAGLITSPFLYYAATGFDAHSINAPRRFAADLLNLVVPTKLVLASANRTETIASHFLGNDSERGAYLGLPTLTMIALFAWRRGRTASGKLLILCLAAATVAELGASLRVDGRRLLPLPLSLIDHLSLFDNVLPARIAVYVSLLAALIVALWAAQTASRRLSIALPALAVIALLPRPGSHAWITEPDNPRFISERVYQSCLKPGENTLVYPFGAKGNSMLWQAESSFWFRLAGGYLSPTIPAPFRRFRAAHASLHRSITAADIRQLARAKNVTAIIVDERHRTPWHALLPGTPTKIADILLYQVAGTTSANAVVSHGKAPTRLGVTRSCRAASRS